MGKTYTVYVLVDTRDGCIRYVGCTTQIPSRRLSEHVSTAKSGRDGSVRGEWIRELLACGHRPEQQIVESGPADLWQEAERRWISYYRDLGVALVNSTDGGAGSPGWVMGDAQKAALAKITSIHSKGRKMTPEQCARASLAQHNLSPEVRARMNEASRQRMLSMPKEMRALIANKLRGRKWSPEHREKMMRARKPASEETRQKLRDAWARRPPEKKIGPGVQCKGKPKSPEHRGKMAEAARRRWKRWREEKGIKR